MIKKPCNNDADGGIWYKRWSVQQVVIPSTWGPKNVLTVRKRAKEQHKYKYGVFPITPSHSLSFNLKLLIVLKVLIVLLDCNDFVI